MEAASSRRQQHRAENDAEGGGVPEVFESRRFGSTTYTTICADTPAMGGSPHCLIPASIPASISASIRFHRRRRALLFALDPVGGVRG